VQSLGITYAGELRKLTFDASRDLVPVIPVATQPNMLGISTMLPHVKSGKMRALGVTGAKRSWLVPDVPTIAESDLPGYEFEAWYALFAPAKTPRPVISKVNAEVNRALQQPEVRQRLAAISMEPMGGSEEAFARYFQTEVTKWAKVIRDAKITGE